MPKAFDYANKNNSEKLQKFDHQTRPQLAKIANKPVDVFGRTS